MRNLPACVQSRLQEDPLEKEMATCSSFLAWEIPLGRGAWQATLHGVAKSRTWLSDWITTTARLRSLPCLQGPLVKYSSHLLWVRHSKSQHIWIKPLPPVTSILWPETASDQQIKKDNKQTQTNKKIADCISSWKGNKPEEAMENKREGEEQGAFHEWSVKASLRR